MPFNFQKYQGTGNDFIIIDDRKGHFPQNDTEFVHKLCNRRLGIGADGLILLQAAKTGNPQDSHPAADFHMAYYNSDGKLGSMCGNGGRCLLHFAASVAGIVREKYQFSAADGQHSGKLLPNGEVSLSMNKVERIDFQGEDFVVDTGSPHFVRFVKQIRDLDVLKEGRAIRNSQPFVAEGINVNFVENNEGVLFVRTYERGVEEETLSCGTGVTASALAATLLPNADSELSTETTSPDGLYETILDTPGGRLKVAFKKEETSFSQIHLIGPAINVFQGQI